MSAGGRESMRTILALLMALLASTAHAAEWVEIGADTEARYYVDLASIEIEADTIRVLKKGVYTHPLTENLGGMARVFKETLGVVELDCARHINRVVQIDMIGPNDDVVWSSGRMQRRLWEDVRPNTHGEATLEFVCGKLGKS
jgi:hypothetical protein